MTKNFAKATGRAAKVHGKDIKDVRKQFNKQVQEVPEELRSCLITAHRIYDAYKAKALA